MLSRSAVATMAALSTAVCRAAAFVPTFTSNAVVLGSGRARHTISAVGPIINRRNDVLKPRGGISSGSSSNSQSSPTITAGGRATKEGRPGSVKMMSSAQETAEAETLAASIKAKGDEIRSLKAGGADKEALGPAIAELISLKADFERVTGTPFDPPKKAKAKKAQDSGKKKKGGGGASSKADEQASRRITPRAENFSQWYLDVIAASEMTENSPVKGCMVIRPWGMAIWDAFKDDMDKRIKTYDVENAYFPLLIPQSFLTKEAEHVEGFAKECAVVTHHRLCKGPDGNLIPDPEAKLEEPLVVRPTSETIIWTMFRKWIDSYRDLPLKLNQWANVVRWEMRTRPLLRSAEFLWQEGHTAHATKEEALACAQEMLAEYSLACRETLALPTVMGVKSPKERFAGADETYTIEALMQNGWALQSGTSHFLGQNFARAFDVYYQTPDEKRELVWATSWGVTTRLIGAMVMTHSDDLGLRLPPAVAPKQVVIVPITKGPGEDTDLVNKAVDEVVKELRTAGIRVKVDDRPNMRPGAKYFEWEAKGVPLRVELGPRDAKAGVAVVVKRTGGEKLSVPTDGSFASCIKEQLEVVKDTLWEEATDNLARGTIPVSSYAEMKEHIDSGDTSRAGMYLAAWTCDTENEDFVQQDSKATLRCYPLQLNEMGMHEGKECFYSGRPATHMAIFARAF
ncbi:unnamed protein product [Pylaiella littoralis]